jgi:hypothetical protein
MWLSSEHPLQRGPVVSQERPLEGGPAGKPLRSLVGRVESLLVRGERRPEPGLQARVDPPGLTLRGDRGKPQKAAASGSKDNSRK